MLRKTLLGGFVERADGTPGLMDTHGHYSVDCTIQSEVERTVFRVDWAR